MCFLAPVPFAEAPSASLERGVGMRRGVTVLAVILGISVLPGCSSTSSSEGVDAAGEVTADITALDAEPDRMGDVPQVDMVTDDVPDVSPTDISGDTPLEVEGETIPDVFPDETEEVICVPSCEGKVCGEDGCGGSCGDCLNWCDPQCDLPEVPYADPLLCAEDGTSCYQACCPSCCDKQCGEDGCGGICGECQGMQDACVLGACVCQPACDGKECGDDGCGGVCGVCAEHSVCDSGTCILLPWCGDGTCASDLAETCSTCPVDCWCGCGEQCLDHVCVFMACTGKVCGPDDCGGTCAPGCAPGEACQNGQCGVVSCYPDCVEEDLIPAGTFWMGCNEAVDNECQSNEYPYHEVYLDSYYIDHTEVVQAEYEKCINTSVCNAPGCEFSPVNFPGRPVACIGWAQANAYCEWVGKRLPTEAEWERAARGVDGRKYPWGNETATCERAVMHGNGMGCGSNANMLVCSKSPEGDSLEGPCDMAGNVWEWVSDWYSEGTYSESPSSNPTGPDTGTQRILRGGSSGHSADDLRASRRLPDSPAAMYINLGFRCARSVPHVPAKLEWDHSDP
jgi:hypothetical protein